MSAVAAMNLSLNTAWPLVLLAASLLCALLPMRVTARRRFIYLPVSLGAMAVLSGLWLGWLSPTALLALALLAGAMLGLRAARTPVARGACGVAAVSISLALALHRWPGFDTVLLWHAVQLSPEARPFTAALSMDKPLAGLILWLGLWGCWGSAKSGAGATTGAAGQLSAGNGAEAAVRQASRWRKADVVAGAVAVATLVGVLALAVLTGGLVWTPRWQSWPEGGTVFLLTNLLFTCVAEEVFFRGLVQDGLAGAWWPPSGARMLSLASLDLPMRRNLVVVGVTAVLFGLAHAGSSGLWMLWAGAAGLGYAAVYGLTQRVQASIALHFSLNALHFLCFTYPARA